MSANLRLTTALVALSLLLPLRSNAEDAPVATGDVIELAREAARAWADDARLIYVENDADIDATGRAPRWGFLFWSRQRDATRAYSLSNSEILLATEPGIDLPALPISSTWIDSGRVLARAEDEGGRDYRQERGGAVENMVLVRGIFHEKHPERTTWTVVYSSRDYPSLWVVLDAATGDLVKRWEG